MQWRCFCVGTEISVTFHYSESMYHPQPGRIPWVVKGTSGACPYIYNITIISAAVIYNQNKLNLEIHKHVYQIQLKKTINILVVQMDMLMKLNRDSR